MKSSERRVLARATIHATVGAVALLVCTACLPSSSDSAQAGLPRGVTLDVHDDQAVDPALDAAMAWWNSLAGRQLFATATTNDWSGVWVYHGVVGACPDARACAQPVDATGTWHPDMTYPYRWCDVLAAPGEAAWNVLAHELGHCLGFRHVDDRVSIMGSSDANPSNAAADQQMLEQAGY